MRRRPEPVLRGLGGYAPSFSSRIAASFFGRFAASILSILTLCLASPGTATAAAPILNVDGTPIPPPRRALVLELGAAYSIGSDLGVQPELASYLDLPNTWQAGLRARSILAKSDSGYDYLPQVSLEIRKLWLEDEGTDPVRNSEYFSMSVGGYFAYDFNGKKTWLKPLGSLALGKYWMPFDNQPYGLDLSMELSRLFFGHLQGRSQLVYITIGLQLFYVLP
jgi:hypothetical protein